MPGLTWIAVAGVVMLSTAVETFYKKSFDSCVCLPFHPIRMSDKLISVNPQVIISTFIILLEDLLKIARKVRFA